MAVTTTAIAIATVDTAVAPPRPVAALLIVEAAAGPAPLLAAVVADPLHAAAVAMEAAATGRPLVEVILEEEGVGLPRRVIDRLVLALREHER